MYDRMKVLEKRALRPPFIHQKKKNYAVAYVACIFTMRTCEKKKPPPSLTLRALAGEKGHETLHVDQWSDWILYLQPMWTESTEIYLLLRKERGRDGRERCGECDRKWKSRERKGPQISTDLE